jgi:serine/threonine protein kinase
VVAGACGSTNDIAGATVQRSEGKYEILEKIREGGMGAIYKVRHRLLDEIRAIKVMRAGQ